MVPEIDGRPLRFWPLGSGRPPIFAKYSFMTSMAPSLRSSASAWSASGGCRVHIVFSLPGPVFGVVVSIPLDVELEDALSLSVPGMPARPGYAPFESGDRRLPRLHICRIVSAMRGRGSLACAYSSSPTSLPSSSSSSSASCTASSSTGFLVCVLVGGTSSASEDSWSLSAARHESATEVYAPGDEAGGRAGATHAAYCNAVASNSG